MSTPGLLQRPILGGAFGTGRYVLATRPCVANGLHAVRYMVLDPRAGTVIATADTKTEALQAARRALKFNQSVSAGAPAAPPPSQATLWPVTDLDSGAPPVRLRPVSRRRRDVFEKSEGKCHYCSRPLVLDGLWQVEHMMPKALGGADEISNLVAACPPCNLAKRDKTAVEFVTAPTSAPG